MIQRGQNFRFPLETDHSLWAAGKALWQYLQGYIAFQLGIGGPEDLPHTSFTDERRGFVESYRSPDHISLHFENRRSEIALRSAAPYHFRR